MARDDVIALLLPDGPEFISLFLGISSVAVCAPVNPSLPDAELTCCLSDLAARCLIVQAGVFDRQAAIARSLGIRVIEISCAPEAPAGVVGFRDAPAAAPALPARPQPGETALLLQTSATTGKPRLVPLTHGNLRAMADNTGQILELTAAGRFLSIMPLFHLQGLMSSLAQLLAGGSVVCTPGFDLDQFGSWLDQFRPTWYTASPALHNAILPVARKHPEHIRKGHLRFVRSIGAPLPQPLLLELQEALGVPVLEGYGMTETGVVTSNAPAPDGRKPGSVGRTAGLQVAIMDDNGRLLPHGSEGQIVVRGPAVMRAYRNNPEANSSSFRDGWLLTGDLGRLDAGGFLFVTGRLKEIINRGGEKIVPAEIDEVLKVHPAIADAAAFGVPHPTLGEDIGAAVVLRPGTSVEEHELRAFLADRLAAFKVPRRIFFTGTIPKSATGKPKRALLVDQVARCADGRAAGGSRCGEFRPAPAYIEPSTPIEQTLATIWQRILRVDRVGLDDDFFVLGGDSLAVTLMFTEVEAEFGVDPALLDNSSFLSTPALRTLARIIKEAGPAVPSGDRPEKSPVVVLQPRGTDIPFFCFPGADENPYYFIDLAKRLGPDQPFYVVRDPRAAAERGVYSLEEEAGRFIESIRAVQSKGPYTLGGHCYGGIAAFEVSRQLLSAGEKVSLLVLFEAPAPGYPKVLRHWRSYGEQVKLLLGDLRRGRNRIAEVTAHLRVLGALFDRKRQALTRRLVTRYDLPKMAVTGEPVHRANQMAARSYELKAIECPVAQFIAADEKHSTVVLDDPRLGWRDVARCFTVHKTPGRADAIFKEPHVRELAAQLRVLLADSNPARRSSAAAS